MMGSSLGRGGFVIASGSGGLNPSAVAGGPSVTRLTHRRCRGVSGSGKPSKVAMKMVAISPILHEMRKQIKAWPGERALGAGKMYQAQACRTKFAVASHLHVIVDGPTLLHCAHDGGKIVICEDHVGCILRNFRTSDAHSNTNRRLLKSRLSGVIENLELAQCMA